MVPYRTIWHCQTKLSRSKYGIPTFQCVEIIDTKVYFETQKCSTTKNIGTLKRHSDKNLIHPLMNRLLQDQKKTSEAPKSPLTKVFETLRQELPTGNRDIPHSFCMNLSHLTILLKKERVHLQIAFVPCDKKFRPEIEELQVVFYLKVFSIPEICRNTAVFCYEYTQHAEMRSF